MLCGALLRELIECFEWIGRFGLIFGGFFVAEHLLLQLHRLGVAGVGCFGDDDCQFFLVIGSGRFLAIFRVFSICVTNEV